MKNLTISLSLILSLGIFGCHEKESGSTPYSDLAPAPVTTEHFTARYIYKSILVAVYPLRMASQRILEMSFVLKIHALTRPPPPLPVLTEQPPTDTSPPCRRVSPWDGVTEAFWRCLLY